MILRKPMYYDQFSCIGSCCQDTCCAGWEIEIDESTAEKYRKVDGEIGKRLQEHVIETEEEIYFQLQSQKRCPFLNEQNLCDLIIQLGEDALCDICREHPRHYEWFGEYTELGLGLCCEEAGRLLFGNVEKICYVEQEQPCLNDESDSEIKDDFDEKNQAYIEMLLEARDIAFSIVQNRKMHIVNRLILLLQYAQKLQELLDIDDYDSFYEIIRRYQNQEACFADWENMVATTSGASMHNETSEWIHQLLDIYAQLESLDGTFTERMNMLHAYELDKTLGDEFKKRYPQAIEYEYEHFSVYLVYRYFMQTLFDGDILGKVKFVVISNLILYLMDIQLQSQMSKEQEYTLWDRIQNAKQYSKEVEYCTENMDMLGTLCWEEDCMSADALISMLQIML